MTQHVIQPNELPEIRSELIEWLDGPIAHHLWDAASRRGTFEHLTGPRRPDDSNVLRGTEISRLEATDLVYASGEMVDLALAASKTIPPFELQPEDVPFRSGFLVFAKPPVHITDKGGAGTFGTDHGAVSSVGVAAHGTGVGDRVECGAGSACREASDSTRWPGAGIGAVANPSPFGAHWGSSGHAARLPPPVDRAGALAAAVVPIEASAPAGVDRSASQGPGRGSVDRWGEGSRVAVKEQTKRPRGDVRR